MHEVVKSMVKTVTFALGLASAVPGVGIAGEQHEKKREARSPRLLFTRRSLRRFAQLAADLHISGHKTK